MVKVWILQHELSYYYVLILLTTLGIECISSPKPQNALTRAGKVSTVVMSLTKRTQVLDLEFGLGLIIIKIYNTKYQK